MYINCFNPLKKNQKQRAHRIRSYSTHIKSCFGPLPKKYKQYREPLLLLYLPKHAHRLRHVLIPHRRQSRTKQTPNEPRKRLCRRARAKPADGDCRTQPTVLTDAKRARGRPSINGRRRADSVCR